MKILENAVDSISLGIEDFQGNDPKRLMSAVRNFHAGVLLLFKHHLAQLSKADDEALLKQKVLPVLDGSAITWKGTGKKTVDTQQIKERFESLGIAVDWKRLDAVQNYRNDIEHYHTTARPEAVRKHVTACFVIVRDFISIYLKADPRMVLGSNTWDKLIKEEEVYTTERKACTEAMGKLDWPNRTAELWVTTAQCGDCGSDLIRPASSFAGDASDARFECAVCGRDWAYEELLKTAGSPHDTHASRRDGGGPVLGVCPECGNEGYDAVECQCAYCGTEGPFECIRCGNDIPVEDLSWDNGNLCGYCAHMSSKDD